MRRTNPWRRSDSQCPDCSAVDCDGMCTERYLAAREPATLETKLGIGPDESKFGDELEGGGGLGPYWTRLGIGR